MFLYSCLLPPVDALSHCVSRTRASQIPSALEWQARYLWDSISKYFV